MIALLGSTGMLGSMLSETLDIDFIAINRPQLDAEKPDFDFSIYDRVVNCIGVIKPYCTDWEQAIKVNALFPHSLPAGSIQIATDCVFSGRLGNYTEADEHDATDIYGKTKCLGEAGHLNNLRCSIIGPEKKNHLSLYDWALSQTKADGFTNHQWNGITTLHFARIVQGIIREGIELPYVQHIIPADSVNKYELLKLINPDLKVRPTKAFEAVDRTLSTNRPELNRQLWKAAGYSEPPTIKQMIEELRESR